MVETFAKSVYTLFLNEVQGKINSRRKREETKQMSYSTEQPCILLGQDHFWQVDNTCELDSAGGLAIESVVENVLSMFGLQNIR